MDAGADDIEDLKAKVDVLKVRVTAISALSQL